MSYFDRFLAMSRPAANPRARSRFELEQHEVVEVAPPPLATTREVTRDVQSRTPQPLRIDSPPSTHTIERVVDAQPPAIERATQVVHVERVIERAPDEQVRSSNAPSRVEPPGLRRLRDVMEWVARPPAAAPALDVEAATAPPRREEPRAREAIVRSPRDRVTPATNTTSAASTASTPSTRTIDETVVVSIGAIEVTVEAPAPSAPAPRAAPTPKRALRDTRLARRLPGNG